MSLIHDNETIHSYTVNHDCGKHLVKVEIDGKVRYPDHALSSYKFFIEHYPEEKDIARLILNDMFIHTCSAEELEKTELSQKDLLTLLVVALAEIHANAEIFGGKDSVSFKSKFKQIDRRGNKICLPLSNVAQYIYVIIRDDLTVPQKTVQACHAVIESCRKHNIEFHPSVICLRVENEKKLKKAIKELTSLNISLSVFCEPDIGNSLTCIASEPVTEEKRKIFRKFQLLKG